jgi:hypothetical protein
VFVGSVPYLKGGIGNADFGVNVSFNNVKFYGPTATGSPQSWQAESVTGNYWNFQGGPSGVNFIASGSGMSAYVRAVGTDSPTGNSGTWTATVANGSAPGGVGAYTQPFSFSGTATGTFSGEVAGTGTISGSASGVVPSVLTQEPVVTPAVLVGTLPSVQGSTGAADWVLVSFNNVKFWGPSTGAQPANWTSTNVTGSFGGNPASLVGTPFAVTGADGVAGSVTVTSWNSGKWTGNVGGNAPPE